MKSFILCLALIAFIECKELGPCVGSKNPNCGQTVEVGVYIEALCPYSKQFVNQQLFPTYSKLINSGPPIMTVNLVTFGNAKMTFNKNSTKQPSLNYTCQHKDQECEGNILESCAVIKYSIEKSLPFVNCMFNSTNWKTPWVAAADCSKKLNLDFNQLNKCANSTEGIADQYFMAGQTLALNPAHKYVPWITINGKHTDDIQDKATTNLLKLVCDTYPAEPKPQPCKTA